MVRYGIYEVLSQDGEEVGRVYARLHPRMPEFPQYLDIDALEAEIHRGAVVEFMEETTLSGFECESKFERLPSLTMVIVPPDVDPETWDFAKDEDTEELDASAEQAKFNPDGTHKAQGGDEDPEELDRAAKLAEDYWRGEEAAGRFVPVQHRRKAT